MSNGARVKGTVDNKSGVSRLPVSSCVSPWFPGRQFYELESHLPLYQWIALLEPSLLRFRPRTDVVAKTLAALTRITLDESRCSSERSAFSSKDTLF